MHRSFHTIAFRIGGRTVYVNLGCVCKFHHRVKHMPGWHLEQDARGRFTWTTPTGIRFITRPPPGDGDEAPDFARADSADEIPPF